MSLKRCSCCKLAKSLESFSRSKNEKYGRCSYCRECHSKRRQVRWLVLKDGVNAKVRETRRSDPRRFMLHDAKVRARRKGLSFNITKEDLTIPEFCPVLGVKLEVGGDDRNNSPSLDRINPKLGYVPNNISIVSYRANTLKNDGTIEEFKKVLRYLESHESA